MINVYFSQVVKNNGNIKSPYTTEKSTAPILCQLPWKYFYLNPDVWKRMISNIIIVKSSESNYFNHSLLNVLLVLFLFVGYVVSNILILTVENIHICNHDQDMFAHLSGPLFPCVNLGLITKPFLGWVFLLVTLLWHRAYFLFNALP